MTEAQQAAYNAAISMTPDEWAAMLEACAAVGYHASPEKKDIAAIYQELSDTPDPEEAWRKIEARRARWGTK